MLKIFLVEDEPSAMRYLKSIVEVKCSGYEIAGTAENGLEALEKISSTLPDIVITDIKMPVMDGIELVSHIKKQWPNIYSVIVSGYQEFEYAKNAIQCGVVDYLLKPVNINQLKGLLDSLRKKLENDYYEKRVEILKMALHGMPTETRQIEKYMPFKRYSMAVLRGNGLPPRFYSKCDLLPHNSAEENYVYSVAKEKNIWVLHGRDGLEYVFIYTPEIISEKDFKEIITEVAEKFAYSYYTVVFASRFFDLMNCRNVVSSLYQTLDNNAVIGLCRIIGGPVQIQNNTAAQSVIDETFLKKIDFYVSNALYDELKQEFIKLFEKWEKEERTQLWVENSLRQILQRIAGRSVVSREAQNYNIEVLLDEILYYSTSFGNLLAAVWELVENIIYYPKSSNQKVDTPDFFDCIKRYIKKNISEPLSIQSICAVFGISQTYLSRLFRKYEKMSFNEYLTEIRIEKAKQLIMENPGILIKDVAALVGYSDQFYFSRVFRSITGVPPSEYTPGA